MNCTQIHLNELFPPCVSDPVQKFYFARFLLLQITGSIGNSKCNLSARPKREEDKLCLKLTLSKCETIEARLSDDLDMQIWSYEGQRRSKRPKFDALALKSVNMVHAISRGRWRAL